MTAPLCSLCGESLHIIPQPVIVPGRVRLYATCENGNCPAHGLTMTESQHLEHCEALRRDIFLRWSFDACLSRPCPATLTAALTLLVEVSSIARYKELRAGYCKFVRVCWIPDLLAAAESLMQRCVTVNGCDTVNVCNTVNGGAA